jgi:hypothetical protein
MVREEDSMTPFETVQQMAGAYCLARCLHVVADLGVADALDEMPRTAAELAAEVGADPDALHRVLRLLAAHGVFAMRGEAISHSAASRLLRTDHPHSMRDFVRLLGLPVTWTAYGMLEQAVRTGRPTEATLRPEGHWAYCAQHPEEGRIFDAAMAAKAHSQVVAITAAYDFSPFGLVGDIGGGRGHLVRAVLDAVPTAHGILFDLPRVIAEAAGVADPRLTLQAGDFFRDALPACDAYLVMEVLHDWGDAEALAILQAIRRAAPAHATLLVLEQMIPAAAGPAWPKLLDIHMLVLLGGRQRTRQEYGALFEQAGFLLRREIDTRAGIAILEAGIA